MTDLDDPDEFWRRNRTPEQEREHRKERVKQIMGAANIKTEPPPPPQVKRHPRVQQIVDHLEKERLERETLDVGGRYRVSKYLAAQYGYVASGSGSADHDPR